jgi:hypothetical protein
MLQNVSKINKKLCRFKSVIISIISINSLSIYTFLLHKVVFLLAVVLPSTPAKYRCARLEKGPLRSFAHDLVRVLQKIFIQLLTRNIRCTLGPLFSNGRYENGGGGDGNARSPSIVILSQSSIIISTHMRML